ncbi:YciI family protein [Verrucomicrobium sp. BvORR034]|uniref:YciI family protein n=1 Tax=Verrucomicrobium sp. BvORR034 TaxID=1396418 RepID=UPI0006791396|nr:YciI family protein [Verrucomicrobium sp. BvORR034]
MNSTSPSNPTRYMLLFRDGDATYHQMSPAQRQELLQQWNEWYQRLFSQGKLEGGHPLEGTGRVVSRSGSRTVDGPFVESTEAVGGYFLLTVNTLEEAVEIASDCPSVRLGLTVEVRPVADMCPSLRQFQEALAEAV